MKRKILLAIAMLGFLFLTADFAMAYTPDGNLSDWGAINPNSAQWTPNAGIFYTVNPPVGNGGYVGPGWGGQLFHVDALYVTADNTNLYLALITGFPNTAGGVLYGGSYYSAGDIAIDFGANGTWDYGIEIGDHKAGYGGYNGTPGHIYTGITWQADTSWGGVSSPLYMLTAATDAGTANGFAYNNTFYGNNHWVIELSIPKTYFGSDWNEYGIVHWTMSCGNDNINVTTTPEPMSMALLGGGLFALLGSRLRRRK